jgi:RNA ligase
MSPPPYPRIPHIVSGRGTRDDLELTGGSVARLLRDQVVVEEKLDGANVALWLDHGAVAVGLRSGEGGLDRGGQLGPLRAWVGERSDDLRRLLEDGATLYAEWLYLQHTVAYNRLPSYLIGLDLYEPRRGFAPPDRRNERLADTAIAPPPELHRGSVGDAGQLDGMLAVSRLGDEPMEGLIVRTMAASEPRIAKMIRAGFAHIGDEAWRMGRPLNRLAGAGRRWR